MLSIEADHLPQERDGQKILPLVLLLEDDLGQYRSGNVLARLGIIDDEVFALFHHDGEIFERHIGACARVVESAVRVLLDRDRFLVLCHDARAVPNCSGCLRNRLGP
jgi:hypothetical protein